MSEVVTCTVTDGVAHIELNRPDMANTLNMALGTGLRAGPGGPRRRVRSVGRRGRRRP